MKSDTWLSILGAGAGAATWIVIAAASGRREAWDSSAYFTLGIPLVCLVSSALAYARPRLWRRWGVLPMAGQFGWLLVTQGPGNLLPLGIVAFAILSIPSLVAARIAAALSKRTGAARAGPE